MATDQQAGATFPLVGVEGTAHVANTLANMHPMQAMRKLQKEAGLQQPLCTPLMGMVDQLGIPRMEAHRFILHTAKHSLLSAVMQTAAWDRVKLERLLNASFKFLGISELRDVPLAVMEKLEQVPPVFLKQLAADKLIFRELPAKVQRQVWEFDKNLLQADALPPVGQYKYEVATVMRGLAMDEFLPAVVNAAVAAGGRAPDGSIGKPDKAAAAALDNESEDNGGLQSRGSLNGSSGGGGGSGGAGRAGAAGSSSSRVTRPVTRKILRKGSAVVQLLKGMVGTSHKIYNQIVELCVVKFRDSDVLYVGHKECSYCTLRTQLLMALHDVGSTVATRDRCHELAWTLDAGITNGYLTDKHLQKLTKFFEDMEQAEARVASHEAANAKGRAKNKAGHVQDEAESAGNVPGGGSGVVEPYRVLADAGVILRDPSAMHLLAGAVLQMVLPAALKGTLPADVPGLTPLLRMMALAVDCRQMLRDRKYRYPEADQRVVRDVLPLLAAWAVLHDGCASPSADQLPVREDGELPGGWGVPAAAAVARVQEVLPRSEVARRITQAFALERVLRRDWLGAARCCKLLAASLKISALQEGWDFAGALAQRLAELVKQRMVPPDSLLWHYAVDHILVRTVDAHTQVHEEVLRLLLAAAPLLKPEEVGQYLALTLEHSKKSRRRVSKKAAAAAAAAAAGGGGVGGIFGFPALSGFEGGGSEIGSDLGSDGWAGISQLKLSASDGVRSVYSQFLRLPNVTRESAPALHKYLEEGDAAAAAAKA